jgi:hypothetical protein
VQACVAGQFRQAEDGVISGGAVIEDGGQEPPRPPRLLGRARKVPRPRDRRPQEQLGHAVNYSAALVGRIEVGERVPSPDFARRCDEVLDAGGLFAHLRDSMNSDVHAYPTWFWEFVEREREATSIREFNALAVPGLLQTEEYARALFRACKPTDSDEEIGQHVAARLERQRILDRSRPPMLWAVVDEGVLRSRRFQSGL